MEYTGAGIRRQTVKCDCPRVKAVVDKLHTGKISQNISSFKAVKSPFGACVLFQLSGYEGEGTVAQACDRSMVTVSSLQISLGSQPNLSRQCRVDGCVSMLDGVSSLYLLPVCPLV